MLISVHQVFLVATFFLTLASHFLAHVPLRTVWGMHFRGLYDRVCDWSIRLTSKLLRSVTSLSLSVYIAPFINIFVAATWITTMPRSGCLLSHWNCFFLWRLTVPYSAFILFYTVVIPHLNTGPHEIFIMDESENCQKNWWTNLLYISNLWSTREQVR